jgi:hypothetical protein
VKRLKITHPTETTGQNIYITVLTKFFQAKRFLSANNRSKTEKNVVNMHCKEEKIYFVA